MNKKAMILFLGLVFVTLVQAQTRRITGNVSSAEDREPVIGAFISVKGTKISTVTNLEGKFSLENVPADAKSLVVSSVGMETKEEQINGRSVIDVILTTNTNLLDEVIVVAYGTTTKSSYTGSASKISTEAIEMRPITNITQALSGAMAGVQVGNNSGQPGTGPSIRIRGISSINDANSPLYVVDGAPYENALSSLAPDDIESVTVLKDASSTALYGARAAAGVVIITTKKGKKGKPAVNIKATQSFAKVGMEFYDLVNADDYYVLTWEKLRNQYGISQSKPVDMETAAKLASGTLTSSSYSSVYDMLKYNPYNVANNEIVREDGTFNPNAKFMWNDDMDWMNGVRQLGLRSEATISYSGANDKTDYYVSASYLDERGYMKGSFFNRISARSNVNSQLTDWLKVGVNMNGNISDGMEPAGTDPYYYPLYMAPIYPIHIHDPNTGEYVLDSNGNKQYDFGGGRAFNTNHNVIAEIPEFQNKYRRSLLSVKPYATVKFLKDFSFTLNYSADLNTYYGTNYTPKLEGTVTSGELSKSTSQRLTWNFNQLLQWKKNIGKHDLDILAGHEAFSTNFYEMSGRKRDEITHGIVELDNYASINDLGSHTSDYRTEGYIVRANYVYDNKYIASFSYRRDASSKFFKDTRWGGFWSAGLAWRIDRENFMKQFSFIDILKLRASYGEVGNDNGIGYYAWQSLYSMYPNAGVPGFAATSLGNRGLQWETNINSDIALEFGFLNRFSGTVELFNKESSNMLYSKPLNPSSGFSSINENAFSMNNKGIEVELAADVLKNRKGLSWEIRGNVSHYKNKVIDMPVEPYRNSTKRIEVGHSIYEFNLRHFMGVDPETGLSMYKPDPNLSEENMEALPTTANGEKFTYKVSQAGYFWCDAVAIPKIYGGLSTTLSWKDLLSLTVRTSYQFGGKTFDSRYRTLMTPESYGRAFHEDILRRWQKPGDITDVPRMDGSSAIYLDQEGGYSDRWLVSNDYFELSSLTLNFNVPKSVVQHLNVSKISIYGTGEMLYRYAKRKGLNVRQNFNGTVSDGYLPSTVYTLGINVTL
jgi:TonB-linked SusC/RagA family outer membrane protein